MPVQRTWQCMKAQQLSQSILSLHPHVVLHVLVGLATRCPSIRMRARWPCSRGMRLRVTSAKSHAVHQTGVQASAHASHARDSHARETHAFEDLM
eukprot:37504-Chlamydomonas_euryale.AAC.7